MDIEYLPTIFNLGEEYISDFTNKGMIEESLGVYGAYGELVDEIFTEIIKKKPVISAYEFSNYVLMHYVPKTDCFISDISVICPVLSKNVPSKFDLDTDSLSFGKDMKLKNIIFTIPTMPSKDDKLRPDFNDFKIKFVHELHHAYRFFCIMVHNNGNIPDSENLNYTRLKAVQDIWDNVETTGDKDYDKFLGILTNAIYYSNDDEINARSTEVYEYVKQHKDINNINFFKIYQDIPQYRPIAEMKWLISKMDEWQKQKDEKFYDMCAEVCETVMKIKNVKREKAPFMLRQYFAKQYEKMERQFFKCAKKALVNEDRFPKYPVTSRAFGTILEKLVDNGFTF